MTSLVLCGTAADLRLLTWFSVSHPSRTFGGTRQAFGLAERMNEMRNASLGKRLGAFVIDFLIAACLQGLLFIPFIVIPLIQRQISGVEVATRNLWLTLITFSYLVLRDLPRGRSIGKKVLRLQVRRTDTNPISSVQLIVRNLFVVLSPVEAVWLLATSGRKRLGDIMARTGVFEYQAEQSV